MDQEKTTNEPQAEVNFDGLRNAVTPINLMFDGRLYKDIKGLVAHITQAMKKVKRDRPDYQGALLEINLLEAGFNSAVMQWEQKLTTEIQRLKNSVETSQQKSLGATKKISKYQEELTRGRSTTRSMPIRIGQVRNQLIHLSGHSAEASNPGDNAGGKSRLVDKSQQLPKVYESAAAQILRKLSRRGEERFIQTALSVFKSVSKPLTKLEAEQDVFHGRLYFASQGIQDDAPRQQFFVFNGISEDGDAYLLASVFVDAPQSLEMKFEDFDALEIQVFEPLDEMDIVLQLLKARFKGDDLKETFKSYSSIRNKALENKRDEKFNPKQQELHKYLTELIFDFVGLSFDNRTSEVRFTDQINRAIQLR